MGCSVENRNILSEDVEAYMAYYLNKKINNLIIFDLIKNNNCTK